MIVTFLTGDYMLYRKNIKNGQDISALGFGVMRLPLTQDGHIDKPEAKKMIDYSIAQGINYFDTAVPYHGGESEPFLGEALEGIRDKVYIATKMLQRKINSYEEMEEMFAGQLEKLRTDHIDYYLLHGFVNAQQWHRLKELGVLDFINKHKKSGAIRQIGFSAHMTHPEFIEVLDDFDWDFTQIQYNYIDEDIQAGSKGLEHARKKGVPVIVMEPIRGGFLTMVNDDIKAIFDKAEDKKTPAQWALRWVWNQEGILTVLSGMSTQEQLEQNIISASVAEPGSLSDNDIKILEEAKAEFKSRIKVLCTQCGYCMPCPQGVNIPVTFESYNIYHMLSEKRGKRWYYVMTSGGMGERCEASLCIECGICEQKCPQGIKIIDELKNALAVLVPDELKEIK